MWYQNLLGIQLCLGLGVRVRCCAPLGTTPPPPRVLAFHPKPRLPEHLRQTTIMPLLLRTSSRLLVRNIQRQSYSTAPSNVINVTSVPAPHCGSIRILSLNRPAARNAISRQLLAELSHQINSIQNEGENGSTRALILASDIDTSFCAGADLKERAGFTQEE